MNWKEQYRKRFLEKRKLSDGTSSEYINLKGSALDTDFQDFISTQIIKEIIEDIEILMPQIPPYQKQIQQLRDKWLNEKDQ